MKYVLCVTQQCNLRCDYCYIEKRNSRMSITTAKEIVDFMYSNTPANERIDIAFFGGEPLLEFNRIRSIVSLIEDHPEFRYERVEMAIVTNGTIFSDEIADYVNVHQLLFGISCDGPPWVHDASRCFANGKCSSRIVEQNLKKAKDAIANVMVNGVYHPATYRHLPDTIDYFSSLGIRQIHLNPDYSAFWPKEDIDLLSDVYRRIAKKYISYYYQQDPHFINLIDNKIAVILRGGYELIERCRMGRGEFAFSCEGNIYPCERLIGDGGKNTHWIGNIHSGLELERLSCNLFPDNKINEECSTCGISSYCMNWCGCSNFMATGYYNQINHFLCVSEQAAIRNAFDAFRILEKELGPTFINHLSGHPSLGSKTAVSPMVA